jgi:hypothetical protein
MVYIKDISIREKEHTSAYVGIFCSLKKSDWNNFVEATIISIISLSSCYTHKPA